MWETVDSFKVRSISSSSMARRTCWPWGLLILILSMSREHNVEALTLPFPLNGFNTNCGSSSSSDGHLPPFPPPPPSVNAVPPPPRNNTTSHASAAAEKIAFQIIGGLLGGVIFVGALYSLAAEVALRLRFFICHTGGINQEGKNFPERLYDEMTQSWKLKFFIKVFSDRMVLPDGLRFPNQILLELERTHVGMVVVTPDLFTRKWPMVELVYLVESSEIRRVLPLFYRMTATQVKENLERGVWDEEWTRMSTHGDHPLSLERCRHAVGELCKYKGVEYSGGDHDRGRDKEYIREILKRVGMILCDEICKSNRAQDLGNSSLRGHAPESSREVIELALPLEPEPLSPQPPPLVAPPLNPEPPSPQPQPHVVPNFSYSPLPRHVSNFPRRLWIFISYSVGQSNQELRNISDRLHDEMTKSWKQKFFIKVWSGVSGLTLCKKNLTNKIARQILEEHTKTNIGIVFITEDFFKLHWTMLELVSFVESFTRNSGVLGVIPLFYKTTIMEVKEHLQRGDWEEEWRRMSTRDNSSLSVERCKHAVEELLRLEEGIEYNGDNRDGEYIRKIVKVVDKLVSKYVWKILMGRLSR